MTIAFIAGQIVGVFVTIVSVISMQFKNMKNIVTSQMIGNLLLMLNYLLLGGFSGASVAIIATLQTTVIHIFNTKKIKTPVFVTVFFMIAFLISSVFTYSGPLDITTAVAALLFVFAIVQEDSSKCRKLSLANAVLWLIYDIGTGAYTTIITHVILIISIIVAMIRLDIKGWRKEK